MDEAHRNFNDYEHVIYPSISHKRKKVVDGKLVACNYNEKGAIDRFRVMIPFTQRCPANVWEEIKRSLREFSKITSNTRRVNPL